MRFLGGWPEQPPRRVSSEPPMDSIRTADRSWCVPLGYATDVDGRSLIRNGLTGEWRFVPHAIKELLCSAQAAADSCSFDFEGVEGATADRLGLILRESRIVDELCGTPAMPPSKIGALAIVTKNRATTLARSLNSWVRARTAAGHPYRIVVVDMSDERRSRQVRALVHAVRLRTSHIEYVGTPEIQSAMRLLAAEGIDPDLLSFILTGSRSGVAFGAALNTALLWTAGIPTAIFDDDIVPNVGSAATSGTAGPVFGADGDPTALHVYASLEEAFGSTEWLSHLNAVGCLEQVLGSSVGHMARTHRATCAVEPGAFKVLRLRRNAGRIAVTALGVVGDCGLWSLHDYVCLRRPELQHLTRSAGTYRRLRGSRWLSRSVSRLTITGGGFFMNAAMAIDNREPLQPFVPVHRNMDGIFSHSLLACFDRTFIGFLPYVVQHLPDAPRCTIVETHPRNAATVRLSDVLIAIINGYSQSVQRSSAEEREKLEGLGEHLMGLGRSHPCVFRARIERLREQVLAAHLTTLDRVLMSPEPGGSGARDWRRDVDAQKRAIAVALASKAYQWSSDDDEVTPQLISAVGAMFLGWWGLWRKSEQVLPSLRM
jgi:hypothetical protein